MHMCNETEQAEAKYLHEMIQIELRALRDPSRFLYILSFFYDMNRPLPLYICHNKTHSKII